MSAAISNYNRYTDRIKQVFDPKSGVDANWFTDRNYRPSAVQVSVDQQAAADACPLPVDEFEASTRLIPMSSECNWLTLREYSGS